MPYRSKRQRAYMHANLPKVAKRWDERYGGKVVKKAVRRYQRARRS